MIELRRSLAALLQRQYSLRHCNRKIQRNICWYLRQAVSGLDPTAAQSIVFLSLNLFPEPDSCHLQSEVGSRYQGHLRHTREEHPLDRFRKSAVATLFH